MSIPSNMKDRGIRRGPIRPALMLLLLAASIMIDTSSSFAGGLNTAFSKVIIEGLTPGQKYNVKNLSAPPFEINNTSSRKVELKVDIVIPGADELTDGYIPIPDVGWITLDENSFEIEPGASAGTNIYIDIPDGADYEGKKFAVFIWSHTVGESLGVGLMSKLLFTTIRQE